jgi:hypothetical protein
MIPAARCPSEFRRAERDRTRRPEMAHPFRPHLHHDPTQYRVWPCPGGRRPTAGWPPQAPARYALGTSRGEEAPVMAEPGDRRAAPAGGHGRLRASHADRDQAIEVLKDAFAQGRLDTDELDARVGQAFASRTYAELAAVTADIPAAPAAIQPVAAAPVAAGQASTPARTLAKAGLRAALSVLVAAVVVGSAVLTQNLILMFLGVCAVPAAAIAVSGFLGYGVIDAWQERRSRAQLRSGPGQPGGGLGNEPSSPVRHGRPAPGTRPDPALPGRTRPDRTRTDRTRTDLRVRRPQPGRPHPHRRDARTPRGLRPVPDAV